MYKSIFIIFFLQLLTVLLIIDQFQLLSNKQLITIFWGITILSAIHIFKVYGFSVTFYALFILVMPFLSFTISVFYSNYVWYHLPCLVNYYDNIAAQKTSIYIGIFGVSGYFVGTVLAKKKAKIFAKNCVPSLKNVAFYCFLIISAVCYYLYSPSESITMSAYASSESIARKFNFSGIQSFGAVLIAICFLDIINNKNNLRKAFFAISLLFIVLVQLKGGDRDIFGIIVAFTLYCYTNGCGWFQVNRSVKLIFSSTLIFIVISFIGGIRGSIANTGIGDYFDIFSKFLLSMVYATWTPVFLTLFGAGLRSSEVNFHYLLGKTYVEMFLSLIPGPISNLVGYTRPLASGSAPAWWFTEYGFDLGGVHVFVVPYMNFGLIGVFVCILFYSYLISMIDFSSSSKYMNVLAFIIVTASVPLWFYYGEMYIIRNLMALALTIPLLRLLSSNTNEARQCRH